MTEALLYQWGARALYLGKAAGLSAHRNAVAVVAVGLDGDFSVAVSPTLPEQGEWRTRSALILPDTLHHLACGDGAMAFLYLDALSSDLTRFRAGVSDWKTGVGFDLSAEPRLIEILGAVRAKRAPIKFARAMLESEFLGGRRAIAPHLHAAIEYLNTHAADRPDIERLARIANLSASRFRRAFKEATGVPLRRYRIWAAMGTAMRMAQSHSLTEAALAAGFSSSAHFSVAFRDMFGMEPSRLVRGLRDVRS